MNNDQEIDRGEFAPVKLDVLCPCCRHAFQPDSEQAICVELFGECIFCRFSPNSKGSKSGTQAELSEIVVKQEVKRRFKNQQPKVIDMQKQMQSSVDKAVNAMAQPEPKCVAIVEVFGKDWRLDFMSLPVGKHKLYAQQYTYTAPTQQKPFGWKLVPIEPTNEMLKAMDECSTEGYDERLLAGHAASVYMAAVDVAPTPPQRQEPEHEPVAWMHPDWQTYTRAPAVSITPKEGWHPLYTTPPQRKPLTEQEIGAILEDINAFGTRLYTFARAIEAAHGIKEKNNG